MMAGQTSVGGSCIHIERGERSSVFNRSPCPEDWYSQDDACWVIRSSVCGSLVSGKHRGMPHHDQKEEW